MGKSVCTVCALLINLSGGGEHFLIIDYHNTFDNLYCVGRNGQHRYNNMDHSMVTSFETVKNIVNNIKDKSNIWNVNTDKEYHETKE